MKSRATTPTFLVGCGRSGTTLLRAMLDSHPEIAVPPESYFVVPLLKLCKLFEDPVLNWRSLLAEIGQSASFSEWGMPVDQLADWPDFQNATTVPAALAGAYQCYASHRNKAVAIDKTPYHSKNIDLLASSFGQSRFIHLVRDGRNVAESLTTMPFGPDTIDESIIEWRSNVDSIDRYATANQGRVFEVRYEDLVACTRVTLEAICNHLGLIFHPAMLEYEREAERLLAGLRRVDHLQGIHLPPATEGRNWKDTLSPRTTAVLEQLAGAALERHDYELSSHEISPAGRLRVASALTRFKIRSARLGLAARRARFIRSRRVRRLSGAALS